MSIYCPGQLLLLVASAAPCAAACCRFLTSFGRRPARRRAAPAVPLHYTAAAARLIAARCFFAATASLPLLRRRARPQSASGLGQLKFGRGAQKTCRCCLPARWPTASPSSSCCCIPRRAASRPPRRSSALLHLLRPPPLLPAAASRSSLPCEVAEERNDEGSGDSGDKNDHAGGQSELADPRGLLVDNLVLQLRRRMGSRRPSRGIRAGSQSVRPP